MLKFYVLDLRRLLRDCGFGSIWQVAKSVELVWCFMSLYSSTDHLTYQLVFYLILNRIFFKIVHLQLRCMMIAVSYFSIICGLRVVGLFLETLLIVKHKSV